MEGEKEAEKGEDIELPEGRKRKWCGEGDTGKMGQPPTQDRPGLVTGTVLLAIVFLDSGRQG